MHVSKFLLILTGSLLLSITSSFAENTQKTQKITENHTVQLIHDEPNASLRFEVVQSQLKLEPSDVLSVKMTNDETRFYAVEITLNEDATHTLARNTKNSVGRSANFILDHQILSTSIIRSELKGTFQITGLSKEAATAIVDAYTPK